MVDWLSKADLLVSALFGLNHVPWAILSPDGCFFFFFQIYKMKLWSSFSDNQSEGLIHTYTYCQNTFFARVNLLVTLWF